MFPGLTLVCSCIPFPACVTHGPISYDEMIFKKVVQQVDRSYQEEIGQVGHHLSFAFLAAPRLSRAETWLPGLPHKEVPLRGRRLACILPKTGLGMAQHASPPRGHCILLSL